jgi:L-alanine-DL-glutamate epimerase-like enolase superfamily enzyme
MKISMKVITEALPLGQTFRISRGAKTAANVVIVVVSDGENFGWGEAVPYARYDETLDSVCAQLTQVQNEIFNTILPLPLPFNLSPLMPEGAARNALDCALWDLYAKQQKRSVKDLLDLPTVVNCQTAQTISIDSITNMQMEASKLKHNKLLKVKLDHIDVVPRMRAIHEACPNSQFIVDPNEGWDMALLKEVAAPLKACNVTLLEQPLPQAEESQLADFSSPIAICADESCHTSADIERLLPLYQAVNIKLDKAGGLTEARELLLLAQYHKFQIMVGCMVASSLAMAPAYLLCAGADFVDLDGPLLVKHDRKNGFAFKQGLMSSSPTILWGLGDNTNEPQIRDLLSRH